MVNDILEQFNVHVEPDEIHPVLNILAGEKGQDSLKGWHFDGTYLTIPMPIAMPPRAAIETASFAFGRTYGRFRRVPGGTVCIAKLRKAICSGVPPRTMPLILFRAISICSMASGRCMKRICWIRSSCAPTV